MGLRNGRIIPWPGDDDFQAQISGVRPTDFAGIDQTIAIGVLEVIGKTRPGGVERHSVRVRRNVVVADADDVGALDDLVRPHRVVIQLERTCEDAPDMNERTVGGYVIIAVWT